jgi:hypothetical protein
MRRLGADVLLLLLIGAMVLLMLGVVVLWRPA